jgi:hypothetical protein
LILNLDAPVERCESRCVKRYLTAKETAEIRRKSEAALCKERQRGIGPKYIIDGGRVLYPEPDLVEWLESREVVAVN